MTILFVLNKGDQVMTLRNEYCWKEDFITYIS